MTDEQIIKALECCISDETLACYNCPAYSVCDTGNVVIEEMAIDLINRQKAEINGLISGQETLQKCIAEKDAEIERLKNAYRHFAWERDVFFEETKTAKDEAIKEFAERLKAQFELRPSYHRLTLIVCDEVRNAIDSLVKEMVGDV